MLHKRMPLDGGTRHSKVAIFALGWFWKPQRKFDTIEGVLRTTVGYTGGDQSSKAAVTYKTVCAGDGNVEAMAIEYDPALLTYTTLLEKFLSLHDPTASKKRQYCSAVFTINDEQNEIVDKVLNLQRNENIQTRVESLGKWTDAESRHQKYYEKKAAKKTAMKSFSKNTRVPFSSR